MKKTIALFSLICLLISCTKETTPSRIEMSPMPVVGDALPEFVANMSDKTTISEKDYVDTVGLFLILNTKSEELLSAAIKPVNDLYKTYNAVFTFCCINISNIDLSGLWATEKYQLPYSTSVVGFPIGFENDEKPVMYFVNHGIIQRVWASGSFPSSKELEDYMTQFFHGVIIDFDIDPLD